jgi:hypothetical protein
MNERIKELITQARGHWNNGDFNMPSSVEFQAEDIEKFAELIVRECMEQIDTVRDGCDKDGDHQQALGADWAGLAVARHFGVE